MKKTVVGRDRNYNKLELPVSNLIFRPSIYGVLIEDGKILLSKQYDGYDFPGGGMHTDESVDEALEREFFEETGLRVKKGRIIACEQVFFHSKTYGENWNWLGMIYICKKLSGKLSIDNADKFEQEYIGMPEWVDLSDVINKKFYSGFDCLKVIEQAKGIIK